MDLFEFADRMRKASEEIKEKAPADTFKITSDLLALITSRVINRGVGATGKACSDYSPNPLPTLFFLPGKLGKKKTTRGDDRQAVADFRKKYGRDTSYKNWREFHGLQTSHKDFSFTNQMWKNMIVVRTEQGVAENAYSFGSKDAADEKVMGYHQRKYKFLDPNQQELDLVNAANKDRFNKIIAKWLKE